MQKNLNSDFTHKRLNVELKENSELRGEIFKWTNMLKGTIEMAEKQKLDIQQAEIELSNNKNHIQHLTAEGQSKKIIFKR